VLSLRVSRDKRGYDYIYLLLEARRRGRVENRLLYCGRWPSPCRVGPRPFDDEIRSRLEQAHPDVAFDWPALLKTLQAALGVSRPGPPTGPVPPLSRSRRPAPSSAPPPYGGRPGQPRRPGGPSAPRPSEPLEPLEPAEPIEAFVDQPEPESDYATGEVVLVSAQIEEREAAYIAPDFEQLDQPAFVASSESASFDTREDLARSDADEAVGNRAPRAYPTPEASTGRADAEDGEDTDDADEETDATSSAPASAGTGVADRPGEPGAADQAARPHRRSRRRGGRGRGKPPAARQNPELRYLDLADTERCPTRRRVRAAEICGAVTRGVLG